MGKQVTKEQAEQILSRRFLGKYVKFEYPGYKPVHGRCDRIVLGEGKRDGGLILIFIGDEKYSCSPECLNECLTLLTNKDGDTYTGDQPAPTGTS